MFNKQTILGGLVVFGIVMLAVVTAGAILYPDSWQPKYSAVFTINGEFYVGKMSRLPFSSTVKLSDAFVLQNVKNSASDQGNLQLIPLSSSLWAPKAVYFNRKNIVFTGTVGDMSQIATTIRNFKANGAVPPAPPAAPASGR